MEHINNLKAILHSKRANMYYLEHCRVMQKNGKVVFLTATREEYTFWNIPIANTTVLLLGAGTSITQASVRMLASAGVLFGFCSSGGTPLLSSNAIEWFTPQGEYRPTEYVQGWLSFWYDDASRLEAAKYLQKNRIEYLKLVWKNNTLFAENSFSCDSPEISTIITNFSGEIDKCKNVGDLLRYEAKITKKLYKYAAKQTGYEDFVRDRDSMDLANKFLNHGNYLAYGLGATVLWVLGIPHGFALMHGKTRRGALVFDVADIIKDAIVLPLSFICAKNAFDRREYREECIKLFTKHKSLNYMFDVIKDISLIKGWQK